MTEPAILFDVDRTAKRLNEISERSGKIVRIELSRPERANALNSETLELILDAIEKAEVEPGVEAIVLHGAGQHFCAGADLRELHSGGPAGIRRLLDLFRRVTIRIERSHLVVIAAVHGAARAGGLEISLACDVVLAGKSATFGDAHLSKGLLPGGGSTVRLPRAIGWQRSKWMILSAEAIDAETAKQWGLVFDVVDDVDLLQAAKDQALRMTRGDTEAMGRVKKLISMVGEQFFSDGLEAEIATLETHSQSESFQNGVGSFLTRNKRG
ncbi:Enoyl-CoA hydratase/isomerase (plasmid) [Rhizobium leguminosarum bv. trifolii WSM2304]|uniref:Enoyl-CoA hydratase/isomerase n=1 Tax=Rhizobium leguminosarum bv. trifolii (strain WSM2304) TaxID=395492 RepID=A0ABF7QZ04_RHILW|nr:enoyl-CoA hydratase/isomerase family protein [Rhizobium leguminosarum]ACI59513.1 Enoyl-CoA hydratase/isomerase [Rhizobium leguminosarum bv. trifolii WSM2304]